MKEILIDYGPALLGLGLVMIGCLVVWRNGYETGRRHGQRDECRRIHRRQMARLREQMHPWRWEPKCSRKI